MTSKRSLKYWAARESRETQFIPGHVGGRVASAQPVFERRAVSYVGRPDGTPPDTVAASEYVDSALPSSLAVPATTAGQACVALVVARGFTTVTPPSGWTQLSSGFITQAGWCLAVLPEATGSDALSFSFSDSASVSLGAVGYARWYFSGGEGGEWSAVDGTKSSGNPSYLKFPTTSPDWYLRWQPGFLGGIWSSWVSGVPVGDYSATLEAGWRLSFQSSQSNNTLSNYKTGTMNTGNYGFGSSSPGVYGPTYGMCMSVGWNP